MTLRRNVGSIRSVLASSSVPARTRCAAGATKSSGSSDCATPPSWHHHTGAAVISTRRRDICTVVRVVDAPASESLWRTVRGLPQFWRLLELRTASQFGDGCFRPVWPAGCCSIPAGRRSVGGSRGLRRAVPAVLVAGPVRRRTARPLGPPGGADRGQPGRLDSGDRRRPVARRRRPGPGGAVRGADGQRFQPVRDLGAVRGAAASWSRRTGW